MPHWFHCTNTIQKFESPESTSSKTGRQTNETLQKEESQMLKRQWMRRLLTSLVCAVSITVMFSAGAFAQSDTGAIGGFIKDSSGAVVPGARIILTNEATGEAHAATTDSQGHYTVTN